MSGWREGWHVEVPKVLRQVADAKQLWRDTLHTARLVSISSLCPRSTSCAKPAHGRRKPTLPPQYTDPRSLRNTTCVFLCPLPPRYTKLMMRRIDWSTAPLHAPRGPGGAGGGPNGDVDMGEGEDEEDEDSRPPNVCTLVGGGFVGCGGRVGRGLLGLGGASGAWCMWVGVGAGGEGGW